MSVTLGSVGRGTDAACLGTGGDGSLNVCCTYMARAAKANDSAFLMAPLVFSVLARATTFRGV